jgi:hypothetical protein
MTEPADIADQVNALSAALGILIVPLFPFALPLLLLCIAPLLPLVVVGLLLAAIFYLPLKLVRFLTRKRRTGLAAGAAVDSFRPASPRKVIG